MRVENSKNNREITERKTGNNRENNRKNGKALFFNILNANELKINSLLITGINRGALQKRPLPPPGMHTC
jgi:hypothetical protein